MICGEIATSESAVIRWLGSRLSCALVLLVFLFFFNFGGRYESLFSARGSLGWTNEWAGEERHGRTHQSAWEIPRRKPRRRLAGPGRFYLSAAELYDEQESALPRRVFAARIRSHRRALDDVYKSGGQR